MGLVIGGLVQRYETVVWVPLNKYRFAFQYAVERGASPDNVWIQAAVSGIGMMDVTSPDMLSRWFSRSMVLQGKIFFIFTAKRTDNGKAIAVRNTRLNPISPILPYNGNFK